MLRRKVIYLLLVILFASSGFTQREAEESNLKAAYIYNFTRFIEWDDDVFPNEFKIGVIGNSQINKPLEEIARVHTINNKKIKIQYFKTATEIEKCNILFISKDVKTPLTEFLMNGALKKTLIISEKDTYGLKGACINFVIVDNKLKFEINTKSIHDAGLKISAQLLKLAIIIE